MKEQRAVCLNCMDGRVQLPVIDWIQRQYDMDYVDMITEAGMDGFLADEGSDISDVLRKIRLSIEKNHASLIVVVGHYDCQGNPVNDEEHKRQIVLATKRMEQALPDIKVIGVWINPEWQAEKID